MGQTLSEPVTEKTTSSRCNDSVLYAISEMQGWRISMEDSHATILDIKNDADQIVGNFFGVYDGHGGSSVAQYSGRNLHTRLVAEDQFKSGEYTEALQKAFLNVDEDLKKDPHYTNDPSGCTAVTAFIKTSEKDSKRIERVFVANAGDSRCVLSRAGAVVEMSIDHKPTLDSERQRIENAGGYVSWGRVNGNLALSRAIGDFEFKKTFELPVEQQIVTAFPEVLEQEILEGEDEFLVLACDGIWDCLSSQDVVDIVRRSVANGKELKNICEDLMDRCLAPDLDTGGIGCDNMTVCIVALLNGRTKDEWFSWIKDNIEVSKFNRTTPRDVAPIFKNAAPASHGQESGTDGTVSIQSLLSGGLARGEDGDDGAGESLRLPGGLAGALSGAGIVFRPGGRSDDGEVVYEAHVVDEENSGDDDQSESDTKATTTDAEPRMVDSPLMDAKPASSTRASSDKMEVDNESETKTKDT
ncbi:related to PTC3 - ser/thr protein phosphatase PP2C [Melanopsichium pennsylvanicum]|uniref:protein-serine/threonine phosphatase n=2 Tax=Melanopsichium pennsylvanicum TaxID=63383 RepID=A0AAJ4XMU7_9BASI|nr:related to PTC3-ser/thr protein phosphatase PP2C [Melanopsichium pennsylvanicum 4]SNX83903.1 related to PTC3 - ser/thr protein phosphatase PP2C [Melanopsichium pennsylvanicum]